MHVEGVSEGEKTPAECAEGLPLSGAKVVQLAGSPKTEEKIEEPPSEASETVEVPQVAEISETPEVNETPDLSRENATTPDPAGRSKRRSRSRSRSRGSRDFKGKARATQSPTPSPLVQGNDSSPEESPSRPPPPTALPSPVLVQPIPSHYGDIPSRLLSPRLMSPDHPLLYPGTSPPTPSPMTPLPTLEALQKGLFRSNSAAARMMAMQKLTGGTENYNHPSPSPTPPPMPNQLGRSNTVSGGERSAARKMMLRRLGERIKEEHGDQTSAGEESAPPPPPSPKRKRRRSRRGSQGAATAVEDSDYLSTATNTPVVPSAHLPFTFDHQREPVPRPPSTTPSRTASAQEHALQRETTLAKLMGVDHSVNEIPRKRRSIVVEVEDENDTPEDNREPPLMPLGLPTTPERFGLSSTRAPHSSDAPSAGSNDTASGVPVPIYLSAARTSGQQSSFPSSPFGTPLKEEKGFRDEDEEQVLFQAENHRGRSPFHDAFDREISWIADPGQLVSLLIQKFF